MEGTVTICLKRYKYLESFEKAAYKGMVNIYDFQACDYSGVSYEKVVYYTNDEALKKLISDKEKADKIILDLTTEIRSLRYDLDKHKNNK